MNIPGPETRSYLGGDSKSGEGWRSKMGKGRVTNRCMDGGVTAVGTWDLSAGCFWRKVPKKAEVWEVRKQECFLIPTIPSLFAGCLWAHKALWSCLLCRLENIFLPPEKALRETEVRKLFEGDSQMAWGGRSQPLSYKFVQESLC